MPLFKCSKCGAIENTALGNYWIESRNKKPVLCSECGPEGKWHGKFEKRDADAAGFIQGDDGYYYKPEELQPGGYFYPRVKPMRSP